MSFMTLEGVSKSYGTGNSVTHVLDNVNLEIQEGEFVAIVGFSGTGKSTLINMLAGLIEPSNGQIRLKGDAVAGPGPDRGLVFQNYSLLPWLTVFGNVALAVDQVFPEKSKKERREHVEKYVEMVNLTPAIHRRPRELSGGMRQRVSVARTLAMQPEVLLMDEPLSALDALTRSVLQDEILKIWEQERRTVVLITNDVDEGILMADRIIPLTAGPKATLGPAFEVSLARPRDRKTINQNDAFKRLRNQVTNFLMAEKRKQKTIASGKTVELPNLQPADLSVRRSFFNFARA